MMATLPNFLIVGAAKSGTSSLQHYLQEHPDIFMSRIKEPRFFISSIYKNLNPDDPRYSALLDLTVTDYGEYTRIFEDGINCKAIGTATADYLYYYQEAIPNIKKYLNDVKIIICLRNPIDRAFSSYKHLVRDQVETRSFEKCLKLEETRKKNNWSMLNFFKDAGLYYQQVKAYMDNFKQVKVYLYEELTADPLSLIQDIFRSLEVSDQFVPELSKRYNASIIPKSRHLHNFFVKSNWLKRDVKPIVDFVLPPQKRKVFIEKIENHNHAKCQMNPKTRKSLKDFFRQDIINLQELIHRDLSQWLS